MLVYDMSDYLEFQVSHHTQDTGEDSQVRTPPPQPKAVAAGREVGPACLVTMPCGSLTRSHTGSLLGIAMQDIWRYYSRKHFPKRLTTHIEMRREMDSFEDASE